MKRILLPSDPELRMQLSILSDAKLDYLNGELTLEDYQRLRLPLFTALKARCQAAVVVRRIRHLRRRNHFPAMGHEQAVLVSQEADRMVYSLNRAQLMRAVRYEALRVTGNMPSRLRIHHRTSRGSVWLKVERSSVVALRYHLVSSLNTILRRSDVDCRAALDFDRGRSFI